MQIALQPVDLQHPTLINLWQLYQYDLSEPNGIDTDPSGRYTMPFPNQATAFLIQASVQIPMIVGFALVVPGSYVLPDFQGHRINDLFILRRYRRHGIGRLCTAQLFTHYPGAWEIATYGVNTPAVAFWRSVIQSYTDGRYTETWHQNKHWRGFVQHFHADVAIPAGD
jgi:predicted acetyltransferase